ncbi:RbsD/FucU family protein [Sciscionella sediminilitoris]|uniref:RbsD/FucU family protein n=1 Tax=Sciscionella sediminilitoris TaxID=1445613 RepID=UPI0004DF7221|nr:RbsD/FucU family protein [Sciscionella sp. SE31]
MLRYPLLHPPLLRALATAGHGSKVLIADANYAHDANAHPRAERIHLNLRPGLVAADDILETLLTAVPVESVQVMSPDDGTTPAVFARYRDLLGPELPLRPLERFAFYERCREPDLTVCIASGDDRLYANILLTLGYLAPR